VFKYWIAAFGSMLLIFDWYTVLADLWIFINSIGAVLLAVAVDLFIE
jgi:hypothetical protein